MKEVRDRGKRPARPCARPSRIGVISIAGVFAVVALAAGQQVAGLHENLGYDLNASLLSVQTDCFADEDSCAVRAAGLLAVDAYDAGAQFCFYRFYHHERRWAEEVHQVGNCDATPGYCECPTAIHTYNTTGQKKVELHYAVSQDERDVVANLSRHENITIDEPLEFCNVTVICVTCLEVDVDYLFTGSVPNSETGPVNFTWDFGDGTPPEVYGPIDASDVERAAVLANHSYNETGRYIVQMVAANSRGSVVNTLEVDVWSVIYDVELLHPDDSCEVGSRLTFYASSENATSFDWLFEPDTGEPYEVLGGGRNASYEFNVTGVVNVSVTAWNSITQATTFHLVSVVLPPPNPVPQRVAQAAAISVPLVVAGVVVAVAVGMFVSHRWYMSRRGVEVARFSIIGDDALNLHRSMSRRNSVTGRMSTNGRDSSVLQSIKNALTSPRSTLLGGDGSAEATYDTL